MNLIKQLEQEELTRLGKSVPDFAPGDTVVVNVNVVEGDRKRVQAYEGVVIAKRNRGLNSSFTVQEDLLRGRGGTAISELLAFDRKHRGQAAWRRSPGQALLSA